MTQESRSYLGLSRFTKKSEKETKRAVAAGRTRGFCEELVCSFAEDLALSAERRGGLGLGGRIVEHGKRKREQEQGFVHVVINCENYFKIEAYEACLRGGGGLSERNKIKREFFWTEPTTSTKLEFPR
jgi:hypothetical protein